jgi:cytochrome c556
MVPRSYRLVCGVVLAAALVVLTGPARSADKDDDPAATKKAGDAVIKLIGQLDDKDVPDKAKAVAKANEIERVMRQFKTRKDGGMGIGAKPPVGVKDGIELALIDFAGKSPNAATLKANQADLLKMAQVSRAVAEINAFYPPPKPKMKGVQPSDYKKWNDEMKASSKELEDAIKAADPGKVEAASKKLVASCNSCHSGFRDP